MTPDRSYSAASSAAQEFAAVTGAGPRRYTRLKAVIGGEFARGAAAALALKLTGATLAFLMITVATRNMSAVQFGLVARWFSISAFLAVVAVSGQELLIVRSWGQYIGQGRPALAHGALRFGGWIAATGAIVVSTLVFGVGAACGTERSLLVAVCLFVVAQTIMLFTSHASRAIAGLLSGDGLREVGFRLTITVGLLGLVALRKPPDATAFFAFGTGGTVLVILVQLLRIMRTIPKEPLAAGPEWLVREWGMRAFKLWVASLLEASNQYWDVIIVGMVLSPTAGGAYFVATRIANLFTIATGAFHALSTKTIAVLFHGAQLPVLRERFRVMAATNTLLIVAGLLVLACTGRWLLSIFGPAYADQYVLVVVLSAATAFATGGGPAPGLLLLTGHEGAYVSVIGAAAVARCGLIVALAFGFGATGAAVASAATSIAMTVALVFACRRLVGIDPSIFGLSHKRSTAP